MSVSKVTGNSSAGSKKEQFMVKRLVQQMTKGGFNGVVWYHKLTPEVRSQLYVVSYQHSDKGSRIFAGFDSVASMYRYVMKFQPRLRSFYEMIKGENMSKLRFDIDSQSHHKTIYEADKKCYKTDLQNVLEELLLALVGTYDLDLEEDVRICSSCVYPKISYHVVVNRVVGSATCLKKAYYDIKSKMSEYYAEFLDSSIYKDNQNFRLLHCSKLMTDRQKKVLEEFVAPDISYTLHRKKTPEQRDLYDFRENLCTFISSKDLIKLVEPHKPAKTFDQVVELPMGIDELADLVADFGPYKIGDVGMPFISLRRGELGRCNVCKKTRGNAKCQDCKNFGVCKVCNVIHDSENPFLLVVPGAILFECRRSEDHVGKVTYQNFWKDPNYDPDSDIAEMFSDMYDKEDLTILAEPNAAKQVATAAKKSLTKQAMTLSAWDINTARKLCDGEIQMEL